jgi:DNA-binding NarL/FixJ family response regulator
MTPGAQTPAQVIGEAVDAREALCLMEKHRPDVVLMDLSMPGLNGLEGTARAAKEHPKSRILILSMHTDEEHVLQALRVGTSGYLVKDAVAHELELAVRAVARRETYLSPAVAKHVIGAKTSSGKEATTSLARLTPRLREILQLIAEGHTTKKIARILGTSPKTVENQRGQLMQRLGARDLTGLVRYAIDSGLIASSPPSTAS